MSALRDRSDTLPDVEAPYSPGEQKPHDRWRWQRQRFVRYGLLAAAVTLVWSTNFTAAPAPRLAFNRTVSYDHLVVVAGHAVTMTESLRGVDSRDAVWYLLDYQRGRGLPSEFVAHIRKGVSVAADDPHALLVFSGGQTRSDAGPRSEAQSYYFVADHFDWWGRDVAARAITEEFARDSFENLLFAVCRFAEVAKRYPKRITVVSFDFKETRFTQLHAPALRWPQDRFTFEGLAPRSPSFDRAAAEAGEQEALGAFRRDPYGCRSAVLASKRKERDPFARAFPYGPRCPEMAPLLRYCGAHFYNSTSLPWWRHKHHSKR